MISEKYYWMDHNGTVTPKHQLSDYYICNIVAKYGKNWLTENGHDVLVKRYEELNRQYDFYKAVK